MKKKEEIMKRCRPFSLALFIIIWFLKLNPLESGVYMDLNMGCALREGFEIHVLFIIKSQTFLNVTHWL